MPSYFKNYKFKLPLRPSALSILAFCAFTNLFGSNSSLEAQNPRKRTVIEKKQYARAERVSPDLRAMATKDSLNLDTQNDSSSNENRGQVYPLPSLEPIVTYRNVDGSYKLLRMPNFKNKFLNRRGAINQNGDFVFFTLNDKLQAYAEKIVKENKAPHVAIVAIEPKTGKILAMAEKSSTIADLAIHSGFPAASLFKVVTTAAALDTGHISPNDKINFRGGTYELSQANYLPNAKTDKRSMSIGEALGKSCNPVFGRVGLNSLTGKILEKYALGFGFGTKMPCDLALPVSQIDIPSSGYELSRTAAGFGNVRISPLHAATLMAGLANDGMSKKPLIIEKIISPSGEIKYRSQQENWLRLVPEKTNRELVNLMVNTTTVGTSRKEFYPNKKSALGVRVAGKTGTLKGDNPAGLNNWFIGAPVDNPTIAVATIVVDPCGASTKASRMGRMMIQKALES